MENGDLNSILTPGAENEILRQRKDKLQRLREEEGYDPYVVEKWDRRHSLLEVRNRYESLQPDEKESGSSKEYRDILDESVSRFDHLKKKKNKRLRPNQNNHSNWNSHQSPY